MNASKSCYIQIEVKKIAMWIVLQYGQPTQDQEASRQ